MIVRIKRKISIFTIVLGILLILNVAIPKGGLAFGEIPITWGYISIFLFAAYVVTTGFLIKSISKYRLLSYLLTIPFSILFIIYILTVEVVEVGLGYIISALLSFLVFPFLFIIPIERFIKRILINFDTFHRIILNIILFIALFGIFLFLYKINTGTDLEIPYITVNEKDIGYIKWKFNGRGDGLYKLISTYNNGNIFGLCMLFLLPFTRYHKYHKFILKLAIILTISRTVWFGLIMYELISYRRYILKILLAVTIGIPITLLITMYVLNKDLSFLLDPTLNGRITKGTFNSIGLFFSSNTFVGIAEMTYLSILKQMGVLGLLFFTLQVFSPLLISKIYNLSRNQNAFQNQLKVGILAYLAAAFIDGAYLLIPVNLFLWFSNSLIIQKNPLQNQTDQLKR